MVRHSADGNFLGVEEKPQLRYFVAAGIYLLSPSFRTLDRSGQRTDMPELLNLGRSVGSKIGLIPLYEYWKDVGRPADLVSADCDHAEIENGMK